MHSTYREIERKWLLHNLPELEGAPREELVQGYVAIAADGTEVRIRQKGDRYFQTIKTQGGLVRSEFEIELSQAQYARLWPATEGRRIEKTRYKLGHGDATVEIDVYKGELSGLLIAEVEFPSTEASTLFAPPPWFGPEVTEDQGYKNKNLATKGLPGGRKQ